MTAFTLAVDSCQQARQLKRRRSENQPRPRRVPRANIARPTAKNAFYRQNSRPALGSLLCDGALLNIWGRKSSISIGNLHHY
jgi:hypothetical protein